ncbi:MAG: hypothetical protein WAV41_03780 [Microgenomates group bacterium]
MINPRLNPWNIYGNFSNPDPSITANVYANGHEWYNSYMPPFFLLKDKQQIANIRKKLDKEYIQYISTIFSPKNRLKTIKLQYYRIKKFFSLSKKLIPEFEKIDDLQKLNQLLYKSINLMQTYLNPLEAIVTGKRSLYNPIPHIFKNQHTQIESLKKSPSLETIFIPMSIIFTHRKTFSIEYKKVFKYLTSTLFCTSRDLQFAFKYVEKTYHYSHFMELFDAQHVVKQNYHKILHLSELTPTQEFVHHLQTISGILTWSKYIPISYKPLHFRYFCEIETYSILLNTPEVKASEFLKKELSIKSNSGSEKFAKTIFAFKYFNHF